MEALQAAVDRLEAGDLDEGLDACDRLLPTIDESTRRQWVETLPAETMRDKLVLGLILRSLGQLDIAIEMFQDGRKDPDLGLTAMMLLGEAFSMRHADRGGNWVQAMQLAALRWYQKALEAEGYPERSYRLPTFAKAVILVQWGRIEEARELFTALGDYRDAPRWLASLDDDPPPAAAMALPLPLSAQA